MSGRLRHSRAGLWIVALYALAMATLGFAHNPVMSASSGGALAAYALPDGTLPTLCAHDEGQTPTGAAPAHCDACSLAAAPGLTPPLYAWTAAPALAYRVAWIDPQGQFRVAAQRAPVSRGPPAATSPTA